MIAGYPRISRRALLKTGAAGVVGNLVKGTSPMLQASPSKPSNRPSSHIYHAVNGTPAQNVAKVFEMAYGGIENFIGQNDIVLLRPNLQWNMNGYTNSEIGKAMIDLILNRPGGFAGEIIVIEDQHRSTPHTNIQSGWCTTEKGCNGPYNWFELVQYYVDHAAEYPNGIHADPVTGQINVSFQFLMGHYEFILEDPHPILSTYGGKSYGGRNELLDETVNPFLRLKYHYPNHTCCYIRRSDLCYTNSIARVSPLNREYEMSYPVFKSQHSGLFVSYFREHFTAWDPNTEDFTSQPVRFINMTTLNHHGPYAGATSVVKGHFGMVYGTFHNTGWDNETPYTFYYAGGAIGYWLATIRNADLHMSCAEYVGQEGRRTWNSVQAKAVAISTDPVALDYYVGKNILFPAGGKFGLGGIYATDPQSNDPTLPGGYYGLTLEFCRDPLADHSIINGTLNEEEMAVHLHDFDRLLGDVNGDGVVDLQDLTIVRNVQGKSTAVYPYADVDADGKIDMADLLEVRRRIDDGLP